jgi:hypothetical protein
MARKSTNPADADVVNILGKAGAKRIANEETPAS